MAGENTKPKKITLDIGFDYDFVLLGIVSLEKFHRLVWLINKQLGYHFIHAGEIAFFEHDLAGSAFTKYEFADEINHLELTLFENRDDSMYLVPEMRTVDYFMMIKGALDFLDIRDLTTNLKPIDSIQLITEIDHQKLKSKQNLIF
jgi:hypothetical protein